VPKVFLSHGTCLSGWRNWLLPVSTSLSVNCCWGSLEEPVSLFVTEGSATGWGTQGKESSGKQTRAMNNELSVGRSRQRKKM